MSKTLFLHKYEDIISMENLLEAWREFVKGKRSREDVQYFERHLMENLFSLQARLADMTYRHSANEAFTVRDPKTRSIHKASVEDRLLRRALYRKLYPFFDRTFISDSFSCRIGKGTHRALDRFTSLARQASRNHRATAWILKCDVKKFFASIDHRILVDILDRHIGDKRIIWLLERIVRSFSTGGMNGVGLPLSNLTSQLFANVYLDILDQHVKHRLRAKSYIRYADDFAIMSRDKQLLVRILAAVQEFLAERLRLRLHPDKVALQTLASGVDFLGWMHFPGYRVLRTATRRRMMRVLRDGAAENAVASYRGPLRHGNAFNLRRQLDDLAFSRLHGKLECPMKMGRGGSHEGLPG